MIYIIVLNWNSSEDTIHCVESLKSLNNYDQVNIVICDNNSKKESYEEIYSYLQREGSFDPINEDDINNSLDISEKFIFIKNKKNYGYAGGNNRGIQLALKQADMEYVWVLNNDTEVHPDSLEKLINKARSNNKYGIIGSKLINFDNRKKIQAIGGVINKYLCITSEIGNHILITDNINEKQYEEKIDFVVGASMFFSRDCLSKVGLLCEDYFLYYEEIDICNRAKFYGFSIGIASEAIVYHKEGASTKKISEIVDLCQVGNRIKIAKKFYPKSVKIVKLSLFLVIINRILRGQYKRAYKLCSFFFS